MSCWWASLRPGGHAFLWALATRIRANPDGSRLGPIVAVLDVAVEQLRAEMKQFDKLANDWQTIDFYGSS
jgi:hypothetical protein